MRSKAYRFTPEARAKFLTTLADIGIVRDACRAAEITPPTAYAWRAKNLEFAEAWSRAEDEATQRLESEAVRRAVYGTSKPVYQGGKLVGTIQEYSDRLLEFLLCSRSDRFRVRRVEVTGANSGPIVYEDSSGILGKLLPEAAADGARAAIEKARSQ